MAGIDGPATIATSTETRTGASSCVTSPSMAQRATTMPGTESPARRTRERIAPSVITGRSVADDDRSGTSRPERASIEMFASTPPIHDSSAGASDRAAASSEPSDAWRRRMIAARAF